MADNSRSLDSSTQVSDGMEIPNITFMSNIQKSPQRTSSMKEIG